MGSEPCEERVFITHPRPAPAPRRSRIAFSARISKAAPGLFRSRNLILLWVYFSTLENSQCRTRSRPHPACGRPPCSPGGGRVGPGDRVLPRRPSAGHSPHEWLGRGRGRGVGGRPSMHTPATALPPGLGTPLGLCASPGGTTVVGRGKACHAQTGAQTGGSEEEAPPRGQRAQRAPGQRAQGQGNQAATSNPSLPPSLPSLT